MRRRRHAAPEAARAGPATAVWAALLASASLLGGPAGPRALGADTDDASGAVSRGGSLVASLVDEDVLAHRLYRDGRHAEAAELFADPAWKGLALYRSDQWWRAAEAFLRADDPVSAYNLGNSYVRLGYYALALDAYQRALAQRPDFADAAHNAETMRRLLALGNDGENAGTRTPREDEIARLDADDDRAPGTGEGGERDASADADDGDDDEAARAETDADPAGATGESRGGDGGERRRDGDDDPAANGDIAGDAGERDGRERAGGASETEALGPSDAAAGLRARLEAEQATEQWLNRIAHDPARFLDKRIRLEMRRRRAAGQTAPAGGDGW